MVRLNLGSKHRKLPEFDNLDKIFGWLFQDGLPQYPDDSVDGITISHALMFLTPTELKIFVPEMIRVLRPYGVVRITEDDTENPLSDIYQTGNIESKPNCLTGPKMMRKVLEEAGFKVFDVDRDTTHFVDKSLIQAYRGSAPKRFFIEGVKKINLPKSSSALLEGIKNKGKPYEILNCSRDDLPQFFVDLGFKTGAEIGVYKGEFTKKFSQTKLQLYAIDPWQVYEGRDDSRNQERLNFLYESTKKNLSPYPNCKLVRKTSMEAVLDFADESLDFVYIDGNHQFRYVAEDIVEWTKKVRKGGVVSGHDYDYYTKSGVHQVNWHITNVLDAYFKTYGISKWYLIGGKDTLPEEKRGRWRSWMFIKQ